MRTALSTRRDSRRPNRSRSAAGSRAQKASGVTPAAGARVGRAIGVAGTDGPSPGRAWARSSGRSRVVREGVGGQVGPGGRGGGPPAVGQLQDEPWGILPPEVVRHGGEEAADITPAILKDTNPSSRECGISVGYVALLKGIMSEAELHFLRGRMHEGD